MTTALTDEKRAELRRAYGVDLKVIELEAYDDLALVVRAPTLRAWGAAFDALSKPASRADALHNLLIDCTVWPSQNELATLLDVVPALPEKVWPILADMAGTPEEDPAPVEITRLSGEDRAALLASGLVETRLADFAASYPRRGQLAAIRMPSGIWVVKRPSVSQYNGFRRLAAQGKIFDGIYKMALGAILWPSEEALSAIAERSPGLISAIGGTLLNMAGEGAEIRVGGI